MEQLKICTHCGESKPLDAFGKKAAGKAGLDSHCRECKRACNAAWRAKLAAREAIDVPAEKHCPACGETKPADAFARNRTSLDGLQGRCKACAAPNKAKRTAAYRSADREGCNAYNRAHYVVRRAYGPAADYQCACGCGERAAQWALLANGAGVQNSARYTWSTDVDDYVPLAVACHALYDASARRATKAAA